MTEDMKESAVQLRELGPEECGNYRRTPGRDKAIDVLFRRRGVHISGE